MAHKTHDLVVKTGEYTDRNGQTKASYEPIGSLMMSDKGPFILLKRTFNPAGVPVDGDRVMVSCFEPRNDQQGGNNGNRQQSARQASYDAQRPQSGGYGGSAAGAPNDLDDSIPFAAEVRL